jgi:acyl-coenzyme A synthetase/AMP-(fatty) acid ligase
MNPKKRLPINISLHESIRHWARYATEKSAIITEEREISYGVLQTAVDDCRRRISAQKLRRQTRIGILVDGKAEFVVAISAVLASGCAPVFINLGLSSTARRSMLSDADCKVIIVDHSNEETVLRLKGTRRVTIPQAHTFKPRLSFQDQPPNERYVDDVWGIIYSSGTTGKAKGIVRSDFSMLNELVGWCLELEIQRGSIFYIARPLYYTGGFVLTAAALLMGSSVILPNTWSVASYQRLMKTHTVDLAFLIPDQIRELSRAKLSDPSSWPRPRRILTMGAPTDPALKEFVSKSLGCVCLESWGNSEGLGTITCEADARIRPASIGRPFLSDELFVVNERGKQLPPNTVGRIAGRVDSSLSAYRNRRDLNRQLIHGRMVISEDLGYVDEHGYFYLMGRVTQRMIRNGMPIFAGDIEAALRSVTGIRDVAVAGVKDSTQGEIPVAAVVLDDRAPNSLHRLLADANKRLSFEQRVIHLYLVASLPRNPAGKIDYNALSTKVFTRSADCTFDDAPDRG